MSSRPKQVYLPGAISSNTICCCTSLRLFRYTLPHFFIRVNINPSLFGGCRSFGGIAGVGEVGADATRFPRVTVTQAPQYHLNRELCSSLPLQPFRCAPPAGPSSTGFRIFVLRLDAGGRLLPSEEIVRCQFILSDDLFYLRDCRLLLLFLGFVDQLFQSFSLSQKFCERRHRSFHSFRNYHHK